MFWHENTARLSSPPSATRELLNLPFLQGLLRSCFWIPPRGLDGCKKVWNFNWDAAAAETSLGEAPLCFMNVWNKERQRGPSFSCSQESWAETESLDDCKGRRRAEVQNNDCRREEHIYTCTALFHCRWRNHVSSSSMLSPLVAVGPLQNIYSHSNASYPVCKGPVPYSLKTEALGWWLTRPMTQS